MIPDPNVRVQAVIDGQGLALYDSLIADEVMAGRLYQYEAIALAEYGYYLVYPNEVANNPSIQIFRDLTLSGTSGPRSDGNIIFPTTPSLS